MEMIEILAKYDVDLTNGLSQADLVKLAVAYRAMLATLQTDTETQAAREKATRDELVSGNLDSAESVTAQLRSIISDARDEFGDDILPALVETVQKMKQDLFVLRDFHVTETARENKPERVKDDEEAEERKAEAIALRDAIGSLHLLMGRPTLCIRENPDDEDSAVLFETTNDNKEKVTLPKLPHLPKGNFSGNVGKGAKSKQMLYEVDGARVAPGTLFYNVVRNFLCDFKAGFTVKTSDVTKMIEESGQKMLVDGYDNKWTVTVGEHTLSGWIPTDSE